MIISVLGVALAWPLARWWRWEVDRRAPQPERWLFSMGLLLTVAGGLLALVASTHLVLVGVGLASLGCGVTLLAAGEVRAHRSSS